MAEPMVVLKPPKHFSGEPEYPVEGADPPEVRYLVRRSKN